MREVSFTSTDSSELLLLLCQNLEPPTLSSTHGHGHPITEEINTTETLVLTSEDTEDKSEDTGDIQYLHKYKVQACCDKVVTYSPLSTDRRTD